MSCICMRSLKIIHNDFKESLYMFGLMVKKTRNYLENKRYCKILTRVHLILIILINLDN